MIKVIAKITNNNQNSNDKKKKTIKSPPYIQKSLSYKNTDAQHIGHKTTRHFLQY